LWREIEKCGEVFSTTRDRLEHENTEHFSPTQQGESSTRQAPPRTRRAQRRNAGSDDNALILAQQPRASSQFYQPAATPAPDFNALVQNMSTLVLDQGNIEHVNVPGNITASEITAQTVNARGGITAASHILDPNLLFQQTEYARPRVPPETQDVFANRLEARTINAGGHIYTSELTTGIPPNPDQMNQN
jgi:hypothetical protein